MKKHLILIIIITTIAILCSCGESSPGNINSEKTAAPTEIPEPTATTVPQTYISCEKNVFIKGEKISVSYFGTDSKDWIGIYPEDAEPGPTPSVLWEYSEGEGTIEFDSSKLGAGMYGIYLCDNDGYNVLYMISVEIKDQSDANDYGVADGEFYAEKTDGVTHSLVKITPSTGEKLVYTVCWSQNGKRLDGYEPIASVEHSGEEEFEIAFNDCLFMPIEADSVEISVNKGNSKAFYADATDVMKLEKSEKLYTFSVLTDLHIIESTVLHTSHFKSAFRDIKTLTPNTSAIITVGDNTDNGTVAAYEYLMKLVGEETAEWNVPIYYTLGNHDLCYNGTYDNQVELFKKYTKAPNSYYSFEIENTKFIILASEDRSLGGSVGKTQLSWLENELAACDKSKPVFLFVHQPLIDTVSGSLYSTDHEIQDWFGFSAQNGKLREILKNYPNAVLFTGHTHWTFESNQPILYGKGEDATFVNCASVGYLWNDYDKTESGSEGWYVEVYEDCILLKAREFVKGKWCAAAQFMIPIC